MVTHDPRAAEAAHHLIYLDKGQLNRHRPGALMFFLKLVARNVFRARLRSTLTIVGFDRGARVRAACRPWCARGTAGSDAASATRLIARNAISLTFSMPVYYREKIRASRA